MGQQLDLIFFHPTLPIISTGLLGLADFLSKEGYNVAIYDLSLYSDKEVDELLKKVVIESPPPIIGISIQWFHQLVAAIELAKKIKNKRKGRFPYIVVGGYGVSSFIKMIDEIIEQFDFVIKGDAYSPLLLLLREVKNKREPDLDKIPNLLYKGKTQTAYNYIVDATLLNSIEYKPWSYIYDFEVFMRKRFWGSISELTSYDPLFFLAPGIGCTGNCGFCGGSITAHKNIRGSDKLIWREPEKLLNDIKTAFMHNFKAVHACFDPLPYSREYWLEVLNKVEKVKRFGFIWESFSLPDIKLVELFIEKFHPFLLVISPESSLENIRNKNRSFPFSNSELEEIVYYVLRRGGEVALFFSYFLAGDDKRTIAQTKEYIREVRAKSWANLYLYYYPLSPDPESQFLKDPNRYNLKHELNSINDYVTAIRYRKWWQRNIKGWYPSSMEPEERDLIDLSITLEETIYKRYPKLYLKIIKKLGIGEKVERLWRRVAKKFYTYTNPPQFKEVISFLVKNLIY